jgi:hypothetical protein
MRAPIASVRQHSGRLRSAVLVAAAQTPAPPSQDDRPTFRSGVSLVEVSALVRGDGDSPIEDFTVADFEVLEDGESRPVVSARYLSTTASPRTITRPTALEARASMKS